MLVAGFLQMFTPGTRQICDSPSLSTALLDSNHRSRWDAEMTQRLALSLITDLHPPKTGAPLSQNEKRMRKAPQSSMDQFHLEETASPDFFINLNYCFYSYNLAREEESNDDIWMSKKISWTVERWGRVCSTTVNNALDRSCEIHQQLWTFSGRADDNKQLSGQITCYLYTSCKYNNA